MTDFLKIKSTIVANGGGQAKKGAIDEVPIETTKISLASNENDQGNF